jgi:hypothetical protein
MVKEVTVDIGRDEIFVPRECEKEGNAGRGATRFGVRGLEPNRMEEKTNAALRRALVRGFRRLGRVSCCKL